MNKFLIKVFNFLQKSWSNNKNGEDKSVLFKLLKLLWTAVIKELAC